MNILDNLILITLVAVFLFYCYRKKKFPFRRKDENMGTPKETETPPDGAQHNTGIPFNPQMFPYGIQGFQNLYAPYLQGIQNLQGMGSQIPGAQAMGAQNAGIPSQEDPVSQTLALQTISFCKIIPWTFRHDPLPFADNDEKTAAADNTVADEIPTIGLTLNGEINALNASGLTVTGLQAVTVPLDESATRILFVITCSGAEYPAASER